jgi:hypothetical protein
VRYGLIVRRNEFWRARLPPKSRAFRQANQYVTMRPSASRLVVKLFPLRRTRMIGQPIVE